MNNYKLMTTDALQNEFKRLFYLTPMPLQACLRGYTKEEENTIDQCILISDELERRKEQNHVQY